MKRNVVRTVIIKMGALWQRVASRCANRYCWIVQLLSIVCSTAWLKTITKYETGHIAEKCFRIFVHLFIEIIVKKFALDTSCWLSAPCSTYSGLS